MDYHFYNALAYGNIVTLALSAFCILAVAIRAIWVRKFQPYWLAGLASLGYLAQTFLGSNMNASIVLASYFVGAFISAVLWYTVFDSMRAAYYTPGQKECLTMKLLGVYLGYIWALIILVCGIAVPASLSTILSQRYTSLSTAQNLMNTVYFTAYGLWAFLAFFFLQVFLTGSHFRHFIKSLSSYVFFLVLVNVGYTLDAYFAANPTTATISQASLVVLFVFYRVCGIIAILIVIIFGHSWRRPQQNEAQGLDESQLMQQVA
ncbi:hypothetical protein BJV82DRAFT_598809 [Fennellomyces sp. T-0311]|nr:hypothetical protein BJV82DRAFT_598809 [Fennellomyces sp. T-0311]